MKHSIDSARDPVTRLADALTVISAFWALSLMAIYLYDILGRELFNKPFLGTYEIVGNSIVAIVFLAIPSAIKRGTMLRTTIVFDAVNDGKRRVIDVLSFAVGLIVFCSIVYASWNNMIISWRTGEIEGFGAFEVPVAPVRTVIVVMSIVCILFYLQMIFQAVTGRPYLASADNDLTGEV